MKHHFGVIRVLTFSNWLLLALHLFGCLKEKKNQRQDSFPGVQSHQQVLCALQCLDAAQGGPGTVNKDLKFYYLALLPEAEPICRFTARVNRKLVFTSFLEKKPAFLSSTTAWWECCLVGECSDGYGRQE